MSERCIVHKCRRKIKASYYRLLCSEHMFLYFQYISDLPSDPDAGEKSLVIWSRTQGELNGR